MEEFLTKSNTDLRDFLKLKVPESEKTIEWYKFQADRIMPSFSSLTVEDYTEMKKIYEFLNNDLSSFKREIDMYCGNLYEDDEEELVPYNPIPNKIEVLKGDLLARGNNHRVVLLTAKAIRQKNEELLSKISESVNAELAIAVQKQKAIMEGMSEKEVNEYIESLKQEITPKDINRKNFLSESEILYNKLLQFTISDQDITSKKLETFTDLLAVDRFYVYPGWRNGRPYIKICNPLNIGFDKNPNVPFIQHGDYVWYRDEITVADALQEYANKLSEDEIIKLIQYGQTHNVVDKNHMSEPVFDYTRYYTLLSHLGDRVTKGIGMHQGTSLTNLNLHKSMWRIHFEFKAFSEVIFLTTTDEYNDKVTVTLLKKADIIPKEASKVKYTNKWMQESEKYIWTDEFNNEYEAEIVWIPRRYEVTRLGQEIYVDQREVMYQPDYTDNPFEQFELTYKGGILNSRNAKSISPVQRAIPYAFQFMAGKRLQDREMAKYVGQEAVIDVDQIPDELALDDESNPQDGQDRILKSDIIARKTGKRHISGTRTSSGLPAPPTRSLGVQYNVVDTSPQLINLQQFCNMVNMEMGIAMGIPPQREGQVIQNTNVTDNRQAQIQSTLATQTSFFYLDKIWSHVLNEHLYNLKTWLQLIFEDNPNLSNHTLEYFLPDGTRELLEVTPQQLDKMEDIGLYLHDSGKDQVYFGFMTSPQILQAFAQNAGEGVETMSSVLKAISSSQSVEEVHKVIAGEAEKQRKRQEQLMQRQEQLQQQILDNARKLEQYKSDLILDREIQKIEAGKEIKLKQAELDSEKFAKQYDINKNNINDKNEEAEKQRQWQSVENAKDREVEFQKIKAFILSKKNSASK